MTSRVELDTILGVAMIVMGVLVLLGEMTFTWIVPVIGIVLAVLGILMLLGVLAGGMLLGVAVLVLGLLLNAGFLDVPDTILQTINLVAGVLLLVFGVLQVQ